MAQSDIRKHVHEFVAKNFYYGDPDSFDDSTSLVHEGIIDSTGVLELVTFVEKEYGITVPDDEMVPANFDSIEALAAFVERKTV